LGCRGRRLCGRPTGLRDRADVEQRPSRKRAEAHEASRPHGLAETTRLRHRLTPPLVFAQRTVSKYSQEGFDRHVKASRPLEGARMNPRRKRTARLVVSLTAAVLLAAALIYTSFSA